MSRNAIRRIIVNTSKAPGKLGPYNQGVMVDNTLYIAGQIGFDPKTMQMVEGGFEAEAKQVLANIGAILEAVGGSYINVVKATVLLTDINDFPVMNNVFKTFFSNREPVRTAYQVAVLPMGARIEIEAIAVIGDIVEETVEN